jgi:Alginate lyase
VHRRTFLSLAPWPLVARRFQRRGSSRVDIAQIDRGRILRAANRYLSEQPLTVTAAHSPRSAGGPHDYFSEGDYWWPDPANPGGPYIQRDGMTNPDNFVAHRQALIRFSVQFAVLGAAWVITNEKRFSDHAARHLRAWFVDERTRMNPTLQYAQAIHGRVTGRGTGIIDTVHLVEVARAIGAIEDAALSRDERDAVQRWFSDYLTWIATHQYGKAERDATNNHGTCWALQAAEFARPTGNTAITKACRDRFKTVLVPTQIAADGSFPLELARTKPYGYCLFNLDAMATLATILSDASNDLWRFALPDGRGLPKAVAFMAPFIEDKRRWTRPPDVVYFDAWPVRHPSLLFAGVALDEPRYIDIWQRLDPDPVVDEIVRNFPIRQPLLWGQLYR